MIGCTLSLTALHAASQDGLPEEMGFLEYLGTMVEDRGELVDPLDVFADDLTLQPVSAPTSSPEKAAVEPIDGDPEVKEVVEP